MKYFYLSLVLFFVCSCARPLPPTGGEKDNQAPIMVSDKSTPNFQTNFKAKQIDLEFNEWINFKNPVKNIVISPPIEFGMYEASSRGKNVTISFKEELELLEDATYQINFGDAISDYTEGNILKNFRFVFSTGDQIDSLSVSGTITNAYTGDPEEDISVFLYENLSDTAFTTQRPFYLCSTDKNGDYKFENIRADSFQLFALRDLDLDKRYNLPNETVGFLDSIIILTDSSKNVFNLSSFVETPSFELKDASLKNNGLILYAFNNINKDLIALSDQEIYQEIDEDSLKIYYNASMVDSLKITIPEIDTTWFKNKKANNKKENLTKFRPDHTKYTKPVYFKDSLVYTLNWPIDSLRKDSIQLYEKIMPIDTSTTELDSLNKSIVPYFNLLDIGSIEYEGKELTITPKLEKGKEYYLRFSNYAIKDWRGVFNDSIQYVFKTGTDDDFGSIILNFEQKDSLNNYFLELMQKEEVVRNTIVYPDTEKTTFDLMPVGEYSLRISLDLNQNGKWDPGNITAKKQSEPIYYFKLENLKPGWDVETTINLID